jgi:dTDP-4-dehydrorhamnose 3,5-epimerase
MKFISTPLEDLLLIEPKVFTDDRGYFFESFNEVEMLSHGIKGPFIQDNQSVSHKGVLRGLHFQKSPDEQGKLIRVVNGSVIDVVVDIRKSSGTFGKHFSVELNARENKMLWIPPGFAHGFVTLEDNTVFLYKVTQYYRPMSESGIIYNDIDLNIDWQTTNPVVSSKDRILPSFKEYIQLINV